MLRERQSEDDERTFANQAGLKDIELAKEGLKDPILGNRLARNMPDQFGSIRPSEEEVARPFFDEVGKVKREDLPNFPAIPTRLESLGLDMTPQPGRGPMQNPGGGILPSAPFAPMKPPIQEKAEQFVGNRDAQLTVESARTRGEQPVEVEDIDPRTGAKRQLSTTQGEAQRMGWRQTERTPEQELNRTLGTDWSPEVFAKKLELARQTGVQNAIVSRQADLAKTIDDSVNSIINVMPDLEKMTQLATQVNQGLTAYDIKRGKVKWDAWWQASTEGALLNRMATNVATQLANTIWGGNKGAQSEADRQAMLGRFAKAGDTEALTRELNQFKDKMYKLAELYSDPTFIAATPMERLERGRAIFGLTPLGKQKSALELLREERARRQEQEF